MSLPAGRRPAVAALRLRRRDAALLGLGAALAVVGLAFAVVRQPLAGAALLAGVALAAVILLERERLARLRIADLLVVGGLSLPLLALLGPSFALPALPQLFAYRVVLVLVGFLGATYLVARPVRPAFAAGDVALPLLLWFAWLVIGLLWAPNKLTGLNELAIVFTMLVLVVATASAGGTRRRLKAFGLTMVAGYLFIVGFTLIEAQFGIRLPTSRLLDVVTSQTYAVTSVFHNQNDLATYIALCWPFMLAAFFFTRRPLWLLLALLCIAIGAVAFVRTGSRSSLVAVGISSVVAVVLFAEIGAALATRAGKIVGALVLVVLVGAAAYLLFNNSENDMLRQFRLESLLTQAQSGSGSGAIRTSLTSRGLQIAGDTFLLGAGPGQAEAIVASGVTGLGIANLHSWWLETYANGGIVGFALHLGFFIALGLTLWPLARRDPDPLVRYLASGTVLALAGFTIGALGPSSSVSFAPMWILYGLGLAVVSRSRLAARERTAPPAAAPPAHTAAANATADPEPAGGAA